MSGAAVCSWVLPCFTMFFLIANQIIQIYTNYMQHYAIYVLSCVHPLKHNCIPRYFLVFLSATVSAADLFVVLQELLHVCIDVSTTQHHLENKIQRSSQCHVYHPQVTMGASPVYHPRSWQLFIKPGGNPHYLENVFDLVHEQLRKP